MNRRSALSSRDRKIIRLACLGDTNRAIAAKMRLEVPDVSARKRRIESELGIAGTALLTRRAMKLKIVTIGQDLKYKTHGRELSGSERKVLRLVSLGCRPAEIAAILGMRSGTVTFYKRSVRGKLGVKGDGLLTLLAFKLKITSAKDKLTRAEKSKRGKRNDGWN